MDAQKWPLLQVRGSGLGLLPFASSYLVTSRARRSPTWHLGVQPSGAGHPHSPDTKPQRRRNGTLPREGRPPRELGGNSVGTRRLGDRVLGARRPTPGKRPLLGLPGNVVASARGLGNGKSIDPAPKPLMWASPQPRRDLDAEGPVHPYPASARGISFRSALLSSPVPKNCRTRPLAFPRMGRNGLGSEHPTKSRVGTAIPGPKQNVRGNGLGRTVLKREASEARLARKAWVLRLGITRAPQPEALRHAHAPAPHPGASLPRFQGQAPSLGIERGNDMQETGLPRPLRTESSGDDRAGKVWRRFRIAKVKRDPGSWVAGLGLGRGE